MKKLIVFIVFVIGTLLLVEGDVLLFFGDLRGPMFGDVLMLHLLSLLALFSAGKLTRNDPDKVRSRKGWAFWPLLCLSALVLIATEILISLQVGGAVVVTCVAVCQLWFIMAMFISGTDL